MKRAACYQRHLLTIFSLESSTFSTEMRCIACILSLASPNSLILLDELGRGTSPLEGLGIAHAVSEVLCQGQATIFFATHYHKLRNTLKAYPQIAQKQLKVDVLSQLDMHDSGSCLSYRFLVEDQKHEK